MTLNDSVLLVTKEDIFKYTSLKGNVDVDKITPFIKVAQDIEIQTILGTVLYQKVLTDVRTSVLTGNYSTLVYQYVQPMLIHYAMADFLLFHGYEISNAGILRNAPENTVVPDKSELDTLVRRQRDIAETYRTRVLDYLTYYPQYFPEYTANQADGQYPSTNPNNYVSWNL
jgi:hypothetical protein